MLKISSIKLAKPKKIIVGGGDGKEKHDNRTEPFDKDEIGGGEINGNEVEKKNQKLSKSKKTIRSSNFLISEARLLFTKLR